MLGSPSRSQLDHSDVLAPALEPKGGPGLDQFEVTAEDYIRYRRIARATSRHFHVPLHVHDDILQGSLARLVYRMTKNGDSRPKMIDAYFTTITRNVCIDYFKARSPGMSTDEIEVPDVGPSKQEGVAVRDTVQRVISQLNDRSREVLLATAVEGRKPAELADELGVNPNAVSAVVYRAKQRFRRLYLLEHVMPAEGECAEYAQRMVDVEMGDSEEDADTIAAEVSECQHCVDQFAFIKSASKTSASVLLPGGMTAAWWWSKTMVPGAARKLWVTSSAGAKKFIVVASVVTSGAVVVAPTNALVSMGSEPSQVMAAAPLAPQPGLDMPTTGLVPGGLQSDLIDGVAPPPAAGDGEDPLRWMGNGHRK